MDGIVKFYNKDKGFGFIKQSEGEDLFVHATSLLDVIKDNDEVEFDVKDGKKGLNAINVKLK